jgi:hemin uptake protein HemP
MRETVPPPDPIAPTQTWPARCFAAQDLLGPEGQAGLVLDGTLYILRLTRSGKLILTK